MTSLAVDERVVADVAAAGDVAALDRQRARVRGHHPPREGGRQPGLAVAAAGPPLVRAPATVPIVRVSGGPTAGSVGEIDPGPVAAAPVA